MAFGEFELLDPRELRRHQNARLAIWVSFLAFLLLFVEFGRGLALGAADHWGREALRRAAEGIRSRVAGDAELQFSYAVLSEASEVSARQLAAGEAALAAPVGSRERDAALAELKRWSAVSGFLEEQDAVARTAGSTFDPLTLLATSLVHADIAGLRQEAASEREQFWERRARRYSYVTTALGVSILVLGLGFVMPGWQRGVLGGALAFAAVALAYGLLVTLPHEPKTSEEAVVKVAEGNADLLRGRPNEAVREYEKAIALRPDYAEAFSRRAAAYFATGARPFRAYGNADSLEPIAEGGPLTHSVNDLERASELGLRDDPSLKEQRAYGYFLQGRYEHAGQLIRDVTEDEKGRDRAGTPQFWLDRVVMSAALGDMEDARSAVRHARNLLVAPGSRAFRLLVNEQYARARTALELLADRGKGGLAPRLLRNELLMDQVRLLSPGGTRRRTPSGRNASEFTFTFATQLESTAISARFRLQELPSDGAVASIWSFRAHPTKPWRELAETFELRSVEPGSEMHEARVRTFLGCPASGQYRVEVAVGGWRVGAAHSSTPPGFPARDLCR